MTGENVSQNLYDQMRREYLAKGVGPIVISADTGVFGTTTIDSAVDAARSRALRDYDALRSEAFGPRLAPGSSDPLPPNPVTLRSMGSE